MPLMDLVGLPLREGLIMTTNTLVRYDLRSRIRVIASGKLVTPGQVAWAMAAGADFAVSARGFMFALGCIQALKCNKNTCPTGITTNDRRLQKGLNPADKAVRVATYVKELTHEVQMIARSCGVAQADKLDRHHVRLVGATAAASAWIFSTHGPQPKCRTSSKIEGWVTISHPYVKNRTAYFRLAVGASSDASPNKVDSFTGWSSAASAPASSASSALGVATLLL